MDASILHRIGYKIIIGSRVKEGPGRKRERGHKTEVGSSTGRNNKDVKNVRILNRNM